jgi:hypothetical protein
MDERGKETIEGQKEREGEREGRKRLGELFIRGG